MKITSKTLLLVSGAGIFVSFLTGYLEKGSYPLCSQIGEYTYQSTCRLVEAITLITFPIFVLSLLLLFLKKEEVSETWRKFTTVFFGAYALVVIFTPWYLGDGFMNIQKESVAILGSIFYGAISLILIIKKSIQLRGEKK